MKYTAALLFVAASHGANSLSVAPRIAASRGTLAAFLHNNDYRKTTSSSSLSTARTRTTKLYSASAAISADGSYDGGEENFKYGPGEKMKAVHTRIPVLAEH